MVEKTISAFLQTFTLNLCPCETTYALRGEASVNGRSTLYKQWIRPYREFFK